MADRYVNYDKLLEERHRLGLDETSMIHKVNAFNQFINHLSTADVVEVRHGMLEANLIKPWNGQVVNWKCSVCSGITSMYSNYCPHYGAKMDGQM